nr:ISAs1 family transposase [Streptococcus orisasini]
MRCVIIGIIGKSNTVKTFPTFAKHLLAFDDKTIKGNDKHAKKTLPVVSAYATYLGICYDRVTTDEKGNEITAIPDLLDYLSVKGCLISINAISSQKAIANEIIKK